MNKKNIQAIFKKYIENFEFLNNEKNDETYKWEIAQEFQNFDVDATDFAEILNHFWKVSDNLIDNAQQLPFYALVDYARKEPETVREMFKTLYAEEHLDDIAKQKVIDDFIDASEKLRKKYYPESRLYINNQRAVMMYLFLRYPNSNYGYKASQAKSFADCIEFYDDWGPMNNFNLGIFGRMCEQLIAEIKADSELMETHLSRFKNTSRKLHPDENLHILALDIIYSSQAYNFYDGMVFETINAQARRLYFERVSKAKELAEILKKAKEELLKIEQAKKYVEETVVKGLSLKHKKYGYGTIVEINGTTGMVEFSSSKETKKLGIIDSVSMGLIVFDSEEMTRIIKEYAPLLKKEAVIKDKVKRTEEAVQEYIEYID